jgi:hypothetical protein
MSYRLAAETAHRMQRNHRASGKTTHKILVYHCAECSTFHITGNNGDNLNKGNH